MIQMKRLFIIIDGCFKLLQTFMHIAKYRQDSRLVLNSNLFIQNTLEVFDSHLSIVGKVVGIANAITWLKIVLVYGITAHIMLNSFIVLFPTEEEMSDLGQHPCVIRLLLQDSLQALKTKIFSFCRGNQILREDAIGLPLKALINITYQLSLILSLFGDKGHHAIRLTEFWIDFDNFKVILSRIFKRTGIMMHHCLAINELAICWIFLNYALIPLTCAFIRGSIEQKLIEQVLSR